MPSAGGELRVRSWLWRIAKAILFRLEAETAHLFTLALIRLGIRLGGAPLRIASGVARAPQEPGPRVLGVNFATHLGLAAGFDKNAEILRGLPALGFGFAEIGTVTPRPQPGNDRPRLFRDPARGAIFNRMGFNGLGATVVSARLAEARPHLPADFRVGVNVGKNKDTPNEGAAEDYARALAPFAGLCDYAVINVSSPNTPGLRALQSLVALRPIVERARETIDRWKVAPPLLLKLAPEISGETLLETLAAATRWGIDGWVLTNTLGGTFPLSGVRPNGAEPLSGGWSGEPLRELSRTRLREARAATKLPIISVGGIGDAAEAVRRLKDGADLIQIYSGWIFAGPTFAAEISLKTQKKSPKPEAQG